MGALGCWVVGLVAVMVTGMVSGFYLPGISTTSYTQDSPIDVYADRLESTHDSLPFNYYNLAFCEPEVEKKRTNMPNLGEILMGERDELTAMKAYMLGDRTCSIQCTKTLNGKQLKALREKIQEDYYMHLNVDNMALVIRGTSGEGSYPILGMPIGKFQNGDAVLYNHYKLLIKYHKSEFSATDLNIKNRKDEEVFNIVGFEGSPESRDYGDASDKEIIKQCKNNAGKPLVVSGNPAGQKITFTYDVTFEESDIKWPTRWDNLLEADPELRHVQWLVILNSIAITLFLTALVAVVLFRTIYLDFARYNNIDDSAEAQEETGWKQVHGDVFRPPIAAGVLCVLCGHGAQLVIIVVFTLGFAVLGFFSPAWRGGLLSGLMLFWVLTTSVAGFVTARMYVGFRGEYKRLVYFGSLFVFPGIVFGIFFLINMTLWFSGSTAKVNFFTLLFLMGLWFAISVPLSFVGSFLGSRWAEYKYPTKTNTVHRPIPEGASTNSALFVLAAGLVPFACVLIELRFILYALWQDKLFYMFGFLFVVFIILAISCAEVSIVITYFFLSNEDYNWWWRAYFSTASAGLYVFIYSMFFHILRPEMRGLHIGSSIMYIGYMFLISLTFSMLAGFIGFESAFLFVSKMFSSVKID
ncbi:hypothetical protein NDN08_001068 [Rhodosorus marinus]|uniref:Transmembrane 9 superfamily member n=1 Tax=Rhodosorus marinus TaxID=101924 RepID=A0AAV8UPR0_9RHOD|nr:hypothetical protein NDN08_001068 [Rhodosorus marinus]